MVISLTRLELSRTESFQCQNLIDNFNFGRLVGNSIECSLVVVESLAVWLLQCSYQLNYGKIETRHHCGKQCWTLVMTQWDGSEQDIYHFPWHQVRSVMRVPVSSGEIPAWEPTWLALGTCTRWCCCEASLSPVMNLAHWLYEQHYKHLLALWLG